MNWGVILKNLEYKRNEVPWNIEFKNF
jgi:hypothetical protein